MLLQTEIHKETEEDAAISLTRFTRDLIEY